METVNVNALGRYLDGWSQLFEGEGEKAQEVRNQLAERIDARATPSMTTSMVRGVVDTKESDRPYIITKRMPGYSNAVLVRDHGNDLYVSWRMFQEPVLNEVNIAIIAGVLAPILTLAIRGAESLARVIAFVIGFLLAFVLLMACALLIATANKDPLPVFINSVRKNQVFAFVLGAILFLLASGLGILITRIIRPVLPIFTLPNLVIYLIMLWLLIEASMFLGVLLSGNRLNFFVKSSTIFDADDAIAINLSVHKSLLHALDQVGIDTSQLHLHNKTTQGRIGESV